VATAQAAELQRDRERLWLADGDFIDLTGTARTKPMRHWCWCCMADRLVHSPYVKGLQQALQGRGWASVR
jgi:predicted alpha/beta-fold hydrolase